MGEPRLSSCSGRGGRGSLGEVTQLAFFPKKVKKRWDETLEITLNPSSREKEDGEGVVRCLFLRAVSPPWVRVFTRLPCLGPKSSLRYSAQPLLGSGFTFTITVGSN